jgi:hypothetical protein
MVARSHNAQEDKMPAITPAIRAALAAGRDARQRMASAMSDDEYLNAAAALADAFAALDNALSKEK